MTPKAHRQIRVLFIGLKYDYGDPARGYSYEYLNFFDTMARMEGVMASLFPVDEVLRELGREGMNRRLLELVAAAPPDLCFFFLFTDEIAAETIRAISAGGTTTTLNWFADDHWRFAEFSRKWAPLFHWVVTTDPSAVDRYRGIGLQNVILSQWGFNHFLYRPFPGEREFDVTFVGQAHSNRKASIEAVRNAGILVNCWGRGWQRGRLGQEEMVALFSRSRINLNFSGSSSGFHAKPLAKVLLSRRADDSLHPNSPRIMARRFLTLLTARRAQIKGRNFEIPGSGGFLLTEYADGIERYFVPGKEIATFKSIDELCEKIHYFLTHDEEREAIRLAGYRRAIEEHSFQNRFQEVLHIVLGV